MDEDKPERAFHLETWRVAPAAAQPKGMTTIIDEFERIVATFSGEQHRENANRVLRALRAPATRSREAQNYAIRQQLRVNKRLRRHLALKGFELDAACRRVLETAPLPDRPHPTQEKVLLQRIRGIFHEQATVRLEAQRK